MSQSQERNARRPDAPSRAAADRAPAPPARTLAAHAIALQRVAGNRAAARVLARWRAHPDAQKKGVMVPDAVADDYARFNPPQNA